MPIIRIENAQVYVGMTVEIAKKDIEGHGYQCRIVHIDNRTIHPEYNFLTPDYDPLRVNLSAVSGKVTKVTIG